MKHFPVYRDMDIPKIIFVKYEVLSSRKETFHSTNKAFHYFIKRTNVLQTNNSHNEAVGIYLKKFTKTEQYIKQNRKYNNVLVSN